MIVVVPFNGQPIPQIPTGSRKPRNVTIQMPSVFEMLEQHNARKGREAWTYLHTTDDQPEVAIPKFESMIPSYGCSCKNDYLTIKEEHPFDYSSPDAFFVSGVVLHNAVNRKLGKPEITLEEARKIWNRPAPTE